MSAPVSFTIRPPSRPATPSTSSPPTSSNDSREQSATPDEPRSALPPRQGIRISAAPSRPSPLGPGSSRNGARPAAGGRDRYGRMTFGRAEDGDSDEDEDERFQGKGRGKGRDEEIVGFGEGGAESKIATKPKGPLVIPSLPNRDWRQSSMAVRKPTYIPESRRGQADTTVEREGDEPVRAGLQHVSRSVDESDTPQRQLDVTPLPTDGQQTPTIPETLEQRAMRELLITAENAGEEANPHQDMVIGLQEDTLNLHDMPADETDAYRRDVLTRPEVSTLDDYSEVPIEAFGEAMLRGMGWRPDTPGTGPGVHVPQRRPEGLGLGATARAAPIDDKGKKAKRKEDAKSRGGRGYVPVVKRERDTPSESRNGSPATSSSLVRSRATSRSPSPRSEDSRRRRDRDDRGSRRDDYDSDRRDRRDDRALSERKAGGRERDGGSRGDVRDRTRERDRDSKTSRYDERDKGRYKEDREDGSRRSYRDDTSNRRDERGSDRRDRNRR